MSCMFVDSHCHLEMESYDADRDKVINRGVKAGLRYMLTVATEEKYFATALGIIDAYESVYGALGVHPHNSQEFDDRLAKKIKTFFLQKILFMNLFSEKNLINCKRNIVGQDKKSN